MAKLTPDILLRAYAVGLFPMAEHRNDQALYWIDPEKRGILFPERFYVPKRLKRTVRSQKFRISCDLAFEEVIRSCSEPTPDRNESWINEEIIGLYIELHRIGRAHSIETWLNGTLVGGLYGVALGAVFFGESMFSRKNDASKVALVHLIARLKKGNFRLLDTQFATPHLLQFGVAELPRAGYQDFLSSALEQTAIFHPQLPQCEIEDFLQSITHTS